MDSKHLYFRYLDLFGVQPLFTIRGYQTFQTIIGAILTLFCILIMIIYVSIFLNQMIYHTKPTILSSIYNDEIPKSVNLTSENFSFAFSLQNQEYESYIDDTIYNVTAVQTKIILTNNDSSEIYIENIDIIKCSQYKFEIIPEYFKYLPLNNIYCLNKSIYQFEGEFKKEIYSFIRLNFSKCVNSTENNFTCKPLNEINEYLSGGFLGMFMTDYNIVPKQYIDPYRIYGKNVYSGFSIQYFEEIFLYFKNIEIITDIGYFFTKKNMLNFVVYDYLQTNIDHRQSDHFLSLTLRLSSKREIHERSYIKLQTIFSNFGGMLKMILLIGEYSIYFIRMTLYKNYILEFFNLDESEIRLKEVREKYLNIKNEISSSKKFKLSSVSGISIDNSLINKKESNKKINQNFKRQTYLSPDLNLQINNNSIKNEINQSHEKKTNNFLLPPSLVNENKDLRKKSFFYNHNSRKSLSNNNDLLDIKKQSTIILSKQSSIRRLQNISLPKTRVRIIKVPNFWSDFLCKKNLCKTIKKVNDNFKEIQFLLDIVHYLKSENTLNIMTKNFFNEEQRKVLAYTYTFETNFDLEKNGYEYMIKHKKNIIDFENNNSPALNGN